MLIQWKMCLPDGYTCLKGDWFRVLGNNYWLKLCTAVVKFLNQARALFLEIIFTARVYACVCVHPRGYK